MKKILTVFTLCFLLASFSNASACYTEKEVEAEQGVRIHSELMVIGLTCLKMPGGVEIYSKYKQFSTKNSKLISGYERDLISYYKNRGVKNPEKKLHNLRTSLANGISHKAVSMSVLSFCQDFSSRIDDALAMDEDALRRWAIHTRYNQKTSEPVCG